MLLQIHPDNPSPRHIQKVVELLKNGAVIIFPTDTIYAIGCDTRSNKAFEKLCRIRGIKPQKANFSYLLSDLSHISEYTKPFDRNVFKLLKATLPGPFTYILPASNMVPSLFRNNKKTIGIRIPRNNITSALVAALGAPLVSASLRDDLDEISEYLTDPEQIDERLGNQVELVIDGGYGKNVASTVIDCTGSQPEVIREGLGVLPSI